MSAKRTKPAVAPPYYRLGPSAYSADDFDRIGEAIGIDQNAIAQHKKRFEAAALQYRLETSGPPRVPPSTVVAKLRQISKAARKVLHHLGVDDHRDAPDGPGDVTIFDALASVDGANEDTVAEATARIGHLVEILEAAEACAELDRLARNAETDVVAIGKLTVAKEHEGDAPTNNWIAELMLLYRDMTGREPGTSVSDESGQPGGPLIRFLKAAAEPIGIKLSDHSWRRRIITRKKRHVPKK